MTPKPPRILVLAGPTASGKTALAVDLALRLGGELIGADSVQVYRRLDVGSAKPTAEELRGVAHHLLDVVDLGEPFDASRFVALADEAIASVRRRGRVPIVVGGTGLYTRALVRGLASGIPSDPVVRDPLRERAARGADELAQMHQELSVVDPEYAALIHPADPIRVVRALEVFAISGVPYSEHHRRHAAQPPRYDARLVGLEVPRDVLTERIARRARAMLAGAWIDEVRAILGDGYAHDLKALRSVGYAEVVAHVRGELSLGDLEAAVIRSTRGFAKRQRTWFRSEEAMQWLAPEAVSPEALAKEIEIFLAGE